MPLRNYKLLILACQVFRFPQFGSFHTHGFPQGYSVFKYKNCLAVAFADMNVNGQMFVTIEEEPESIFDEHSRHGHQ
jgi:hypothetical protein